MTAQESIEDVDYLTWTTKTCRKCGEDKPVTEFGKSNQIRDGLKSYCRPCENQNARVHYQANRDRLVRTRAEYFDKHRDRLNQERREYRDSVTQACAVEGCDRRAATHTPGSLCHTHYTRRARLGDVGPAGLLNRRGLDDIDYHTAHTRVRCVRGSASQYSCVDCEGGAAEWSYNHSSGKELSEIRLFRGTGAPHELTYSPDPQDYDPRCVSCHIKFDQRRALDIER